MKNTAPTFTVSDGNVITDFGSASASSNDVGRSVALQADGKIVVAGVSGNSFALVRYNTDGTLDGSFGTGGKMTTAFSQYYSDQIYSVALQADGKIVVAGQGGYMFAVARYNADGSLDTAFDADGKVTTSAFTSAQSVAIQADGKIVVAGSGSGSGFGNDIAVARYNADGSLDTGFDADGKALADLGFSDNGNSVTLQKDGKIVVAGMSGDNFALVRFNANGSLDTGFDTDGKLTTDFGSYDQATSVALQADGKIVVAGTSSGAFALARYNTDGSLDTGFDTDGKLTTLVGRASYAQSVVVQADGKILVAGYGSADFGDNDFVMARFNADGSLDTTFDGDGKLIANIGGNDLAYSMVLQADGKILVAGSSSGDFALARFNADGSADTSFSPATNTLDGSPVFTEPYYYYPGTSAAVVLDPNVQIADTELAAANSYDGATLTLARHGGANTEDVFSVRYGGSVSALVVGSYFTVDSITVGKVVTNSAGTLTLAFTVDATQQLVNKAMQQLTYANSSDAPPASVQVDWTFSDGNSGSQGDGGAMAVIGHTTVQIIAQNDGPVSPLPLAAVAVQPHMALNYVIPAAAFTDPDGDALTYVAAMADGTGIPPWLKFNAATRTFTGTPGAGDSGTVALTIRATDPSGASVANSLRITVAEVNDAPTGSVTIDGSATQGQVLTAANTLADADGLGTIAYQWKADGAVIANATAGTLTLTEAQVDQHITVTARYTDGNGTVESVTSGASAPVANTNDAGSIVISGPPALGRTLSAAASDADGVGTASYQWKADGSAIAGATAASFILTDAQVGKAMTVTASYIDGHGTVETVTSGATRAVVNVNQAPAGGVTIAGTATQGQELTAANTLTDADGMGPVSYQWKADGASIAGATAATLTLTEAQVGKAIIATAVYTDQNGTTETVNSAATAAVANVNDAGAVSISGMAAPGQILKATVADADGVGTVSYQWKADNIDIGGATGATLVLADAQLGKLITVAASYTDGHGGVEALTSGATSAVVRVINTAPTFTVADGKLTTDFGTAGVPTVDNGRSVALQADGKIVVAGGSGEHFALARYQADGTLDASFSADGKLTTDVVAGAYDQGNRVVVQPDGKILVAGSSNGDLALVRYNADGSLDATFDLDGKVTLASFGDGGQSVALQADGKILVAGTSYGGGNDFALARFNANGSLDTSFDSDGTVSTDLGTYDNGYSVAVQADGKILVAGASGDNFALVRYNANGSLDVGFDGDGKLTTDFGASERGNSVAVQADGKIVVAGFSGLAFALARYNTDGSLDTSFDVDGRMSTSFVESSGSGQSVALQADGKILVAGWAYVSGSLDFAVARYNTDGSFDTTFDTDGLALADFGSGDLAYSIVVQADGKIVVAGTSNADFAVARLNPDGSPDATFSAPENTLDARPDYFEPTLPGHMNAVLLDANVQIADAELAKAKSYDGASLTLARHGGANAEDVFAARTGGSLSLLLAGSYFSVGGVTVGQVTANAAGLLTLTFTADATQSLVNQAMQQITYANSSDAPPATAQIDWTFSDGNTGAQGEGAAANVVGHTTVAITAMNDAPVATAMPALAAVPNVALSYVVPAGTFSDPDGDALVYSAVMENGTAIPAWLHFNAATQTFSGTPASGDTAALDILVVASDPSYAWAAGALKLTVATPNSAPTGALAISGTAREGQVLSVVNTLADADGLGAMQYQWKAAGVSIAGATQSSLTLTEAQVGKAITVSASYVDGHGTAESVSSGATGAVINVNGGAQSPTLPFNFVGVLLPNSPGYTVAPGFITQLFDAEGGQTINVQAGASLALVGAMGANTVKLAGNASAWQAFHDGSTAIFLNADGNRVEIPVNAVAQTMQFDDQSSSLVIDASGALPVVVLGNHALGTWIY